jgi:hypothetical protein
MHARRLFASRRSFQVAAVSAAACTGLAAISSVALAGAPTGWSLASAIDGGTSALGSSIATTDTVAVVGAPFAASPSGGMPTGAVFVYSGPGGAWTSQKLAASPPIDGGNFGTSVAASGNLVAVGAAGASPAAYVFASDAGVYESVHTWTDPTSDKNGSFGGSVAILAGSDGVNRLAIAAPPGSASSNGIVYVSQQVNGGAWSTPVAITDSTAQSFGIAIAFASNGQLLVGDPGTETGQVLVYAPDVDGGWTSEGTLPFALDGGTVQQFGNGIATSGGLVVVLAPGSSDTATSYNGAAFVFAANDAGVWGQQAVLTGASTESFGNFAPATNGTLIAIGSAIDTASSGTGQVDVWAASGGGWARVPSATLVGDSYYGQALGIVGGALFVGDTSALGASSVSQVTSALFIEMADYADGGVSTDGAVGDNDASPAADGAVSAADGAGLLPSTDAATSGDGTAGSEGAAPASGGCSCAFAGPVAENGLPAILAQSALAFLGLARRRRRHDPRLRK